MGTVGIGLGVAPVAKSTLFRLVVLLGHFATPMLYSGSELANTVESLFQLITLPLTPSSSATLGLSG
jgi:hypothetical protein